MREEILKIYINYRLYIFPAIVALSSIILIVFVISPQAIKFLTNQGAKGEIIQKSKFLEVKAQVLESYDLKDLNLKLNYALSSYPLDKDFAAVIGLLQNLTTQLGFNIASLAVGPGSSATQAIQSYSIRLDIAGPIALVPSLLNNIESSPRLMRVNSVEIASIKDSQSTTVELNIDIPYASAPENFGNVDSPLPQLSKADEDILAKLARVAPAVSQTQVQTRTQLPARGKANPFE